MTARSISRSVASPFSRGIVGRLIPSWTPAALFAQGQQGVWYEPKPEYLSQDSAGTEPVTADGQPVGRMEDRSPNDSDVTQGTLSAKPSFDTVGAVIFDQVDDFLSIPAEGFSLPNQKTMVLAVTFNSTSSMAIIDGQGDANSRALVSNSIIYAGASLSYSSGLSGTHIITAVFDGASSSVRIDGTLAASGDAGSQGMSGLTIGADYNGSPFLGGGFHGGVIVDGILGAEEISSAESYFASLAGVTL